MLRAIAPRTERELASVAVLRPRAGRHRAKSGADRNNHSIPHHAGSAIKMTGVAASGKAALEQALHQADCAANENAMAKDLFATGSAPQVSVGLIDGQVPYLTVDGIFADPHAVREAALELDYSAGIAHYPGRIARFPAADPSLTAFIQKAAALVAREYVPRLPPLPDGRRLSSLRGVDTDFAITDTHPDQLSAAQREPHTDAVPVFGLVYLNEKPRGGTLFFKPRSEPRAEGGGSAYPSASDERFAVCGHIEGLFNRLAIYPGFISHSGEIEGEWIGGDARFNSPRLTQRIMFFF
jgi:hypothetical protein